MTSHRNPVQPLLKFELREELERVEPELWDRAGKLGANKEMGLTEMAWIEEVLIVLGRSEADRLREIIFEQYRGDELTSRRQWSGLLSHLEVMKQDRRQGGEVFR